METPGQDVRNCPTLTMVDSAPSEQFRPKSYSYHYALPDDHQVPTAKTCVFEVESRREITVDSAAVPLLYSGAGAGSQAEWSADSTAFRLRRVERGYMSESLQEVTAATGAVRTLVTETALDPVPIVNTYAMSNVGSRVLSASEEVIWPSERDGWMHLYIYSIQAAGDAPRQRVRQLTRGQWVVRGICHVDETSRTLFFSAGGRETDGRDPYLRHIYRVSLNDDDGGSSGGIKLLTPEPADHQVFFSPNGRTFVDCFSRADVPTCAVLRCSTTGTILLHIANANMEALATIGWVAPEPFKALAADGKTDLFALIWRPLKFREPVESGITAATPLPVL
jgi:dipeptidyl-peptidase-4